MSATPNRYVYALLISVLCTTPYAHSRELFEGSKPPAFARGQTINADDQIGGYQIYGGNGTWQFEDASISSSTGGAEVFLSV